MDKKIIIAPLIAMAFLSQQNAQGQIPMNAVASATSLSIRQALMGSGFSGVSAEVMLAQARVGAVLASNVAKIGSGALALSKSPTMLVIGGTLIAGAILYSNSQNAPKIVVNNDGTVSTTKYTAPPVDNSVYINPGINSGDIMFVGDASGNNLYKTIAQLAATWNANGEWWDGGRGAYYKDEVASNCHIYGNYVSCEIKNTKNGSIINYGGYSQENYGTIGNVYYAPIGCPANNHINLTGTASCVPTVPPPPDPNGSSGTPTTQTQTIDQAQAGLTAEEKALPVAPQAMTDYINAIIGQVNADPQYTGPTIPPVTNNTVSTALGSTPMPTYNDFTTPVTKDNVTFNPIVVPTAQGGTSVSLPTSPATTKPAESDPTKPVEAPIDPGVGSPIITLENAPTPQESLNPILNLLPDFKHITIRDPNLICPFTTVFTIPMFHKDYSFSFICTFFDQNSALLKLSFLAFFGILSIVIVLGA